MPMRVAKAVTAVRAGAQMPTAAKARVPWGVMWPTKIRSTTLYKILKNCASIAGRTQAQDQFGDGDGVKFSFHRHTSFEKISPIG